MAAEEKEEEKGSDEGEGGEDVESAVRAFRRMLLSVADSKTLAETLEPSEVERALLSMAAGSFNPAKKKPQHHQGGDGEDEDGDGGGDDGGIATTATSATPALPNPKGLRRTVAPSVSEKKRLAAGVEKAHDAWLEAAKGAGAALIRGMDIKMADKVKVAGLVSRTKDAELAMGKIYEGFKRAGEKWEDKWEVRKARWGCTS